VRVRLSRFALYASAAILIAGCSLSSASKNQATYHFQMGLSYLGENNVTSALVEFTQAERIDPDNHELQNYLGLVYFRKNKLDISEKKYLRSIALKPDYSDARNNLAVTYLEMKRLDDAIYQLKLVTEDIFYQNQSAAGINLALALFNKGEFKKSMEVLRELAASYPLDPMIRYNIGRIYYATDKMDLAVIEYKKAIDLYPDYMQAHYSLGQAHMKRGDKKGAIKHFKEVVRIAPDTESAELSREYLDLLK
jgi:tetratricopeptide (TPR) repeat protein